MYIVYILRDRDVLFFFLVCTLRKAIKNVEVKEAAQKGVLGFGGKSWE
jgi:hypothetical protein